MSHKLERIIGSECNVNVQFLKDLCNELKRAETNLHSKINHRSRNCLHQISFNFFFFLRIEPFISSLRKRGFKKQKKKKRRTLFLRSFFFSFVVPRSFDWFSTTSERSDSKREHLHLRIHNSNIFFTIDAPKCTRLPSRPIRFRFD